MCHFLDDRSKWYEELSGPPQLSGLAFTTELTSTLQVFNLEVQGEGKTEANYFISRCLQGEIQV